MKHPAIWILALIWLIPSLGGGIFLWAMPDAVLRTGEAGPFISASAAPGGFFSPSLTTVQTSQGTLVVSDTISANRGQPLYVVDSTKSGLRLCAESSTNSCVPLAGDYMGSLQPNRGSWLALSNTAWYGFAAAAGVWFLLGVLALAVGAGMAMDETEHR